MSDKRGESRRTLLWAAVAVAVTGFAFPLLVCNSAADLAPFPSGQHPVGEAGLLFSNPLENLLILGYTVHDSTPQSATLTARTWWCLPYDRASVTEQGATRL